MEKKLFLFLMVAFPFFFFASCDKDEDDDEQTEENGGKGNSENSLLSALEGTYDGKMYLSFGSLSAPIAVTANNDSTINMAFSIETPVIVDVDFDSVRVSKNDTAYTFSFTDEVNVNGTPSSVEIDGYITEDGVLYFTLESSGLSGYYSTKSDDDDDDDNDDDNDDANSGPLSGTYTGPLYLGESTPLMDALNVKVVDNNNGTINLSIGAITVLIFSIDPMSFDNQAITWNSEVSLYDFEFTGQAAIGTDVVDVNISGTLSKTGNLTFSVVIPSFDQYVSFSGSKQ